MTVGHIEDVDLNKIYSDEALNAGMRMLIGQNEGWEDHVMRVVEVQAFGHTPKHSHDWQHINFVLEGEGTLFLNGELHKLKKGSFAYVPSGALHQFSNTAEEILKFICIVPTRGHL